MRQQYSAKPQLHTCYKCRYEAITPNNRCPRCGKRLYTMRDTRWRGFFLLLIGAFLSLFMSVIAFFVSVFLMQASHNPATARELNRESGMLLMVYGIFAMVVAMGVVAMLAGVWQMIFGRRNMILIWIFLALVTITFFVGGVFQIFAN